MRSANIIFILKRFTALILIIGLISCFAAHGQASERQRQNFTFIFMTDIHLQPEKNAVTGFKKAIETVNQLKPDFVITGGDLIMDALAQPYERADALYNLYIDTSKKISIPVYNTIGNHDLFGVYEQSGVDPQHPEYGKNMYIQRIGKRYYSFDHKGWHFMILDSVCATEQRKYIGFIDGAQMEWIKDDLAKLAREVPIVVSVHIPFLTVGPQLQHGPLAPNSMEGIINNAREVLKLFKKHNLQLVLQGHLHYLEDIFVNGTHFITSGAVCGRWWQGPNFGVEEGYLIIHVRGRDFEWEFFDYGWQPQR